MKTTALLMILAMLTAEPAGRAGGTKKPPKPPRHPAVAALKIDVPRAEFKDMPLEDFAEWVERTSKVNVIVRWGVLDKAGVSRDAKVSLSLKDVTLGSVLIEALRQVGSGDEPLGYQATDNIITISTRRDFNTRLLTATYEVQDLLVVVPQFKGNRLNIDDFGQNPRQGSSAGPLKTNPQGEELDSTVKAADQKIQDLVRMIQDNVEPDTWKAHGGAGTITFFKGKLVIRNSAEVHQLLRGGALKR